MKTQGRNVTGADDRVTEFDGIRVSMKAKGKDIYDYPNFTVNYEGTSAVFSIDEPALIKGELPIDISIHILNWARENKNDLYKNWYSMNKKAV